MIGWIVYDEQGAIRNEWFLSAFVQAFARHGVELQPKIVSSVADFAEVTRSSLPRFAIVRTIAPDINRFLEENGVPVFNNYQTSKVANNKWLTHLLCRDLQIPAMKTEPLSASPSLSFPFVIKSLDGHGGREVFLINDRHGLDEMLAKVNASNFLAQELCSSPGQDMRVYVLGGKVVCGILRSSDNDFRSNFSLGGQVCVSEVSQTQTDVIEKLFSALGFDFVGVDFILHNGEWVLNEIEDVVGTRMLYHCTDMDIVDLYVRHILIRLS